MVPNFWGLPADSHKYAQRQSYWDVDRTKMKYKPLAVQGSLLPGEQGRIWQIPLFNTFIDPIALVFVKFSNNARLTSKWQEENSRERT